MPTRPENQQGNTGRRGLTEELERAGEDVDPAWLALIMASEFYGELDVNACLKRIDGLAVRVRERLGRSRTPARVISAINSVVFEDEGFEGNTEDYYDPRNSFLNVVLDRRTGIPITLSVLYLAIARRLRQPFVGVGLPLHFVVKHAGPRGEVYVDPFNNGQVLSREEYVERITGSLGDVSPETIESFLTPVPARYILYRMLSNLKFVYLKRADFLSAGRVVDLMLQVRPGEPDEVRDRGLLYYQTEDWPAATRFLLRYLDENPDAADAETVRERLVEAAERRSRLN